jgi:hypothetical protein
MVALRGLRRGMLITRRRSSAVSSPPRTGSHHAKPLWVARRDCHRRRLSLMAQTDRTKFPMGFGGFTFPSLEPAEEVASE